MIKNDLKYNLSKIRILVREIKYLGKTFLKYDCFHRIEGWMIVIDKNSLLLLFFDFYSQEIAFKKLKIQDYGI